MRPANVPRRLSVTPELGWRVKPPTCISYTMVRAEDRRRGSSPSQSYVEGSATTLFMAVAALSPVAPAASRE
jgi:hypothetical protein